MAIGVILGIVFAVMAVGSAVAAVFLGGRVKKIILGCISAAGALLFILLPFSFHTVNAGEVAVVKHMGEAKGVRSAGTYFDFWITEKYEMYDAKVQNLSIITQTYSKDAQTMDVAMTVQYQVDTSKMIEIANTYGSLDILDNRIESVAVDAMKTVMAYSTAEQIIQNRAELSKSVTDAIMKKIDETYYVNVRTAVLTDIGFTDAYEAAVEAQMIAEREKQAAITKAEQELEVAQRAAKARLEQAQGEANAQKALAEAEAYEASIKIVQLARTMGYAVTETKTEDGFVSYNIEWGNDQTGKQIILDYLKYLEYLAKWDGKLPTYMGNGDGIMVTLPTAPASDQV